ncbi:hypothetical protein [Acinetobacter bereziniae]|uniref:hypothetical protein n=1 Tax=Acinetobacter bereziniae TaxID=106648 RepID=UPI0022345767|nr:hypothetical protein [Acinetobacter bereziniae]
MQRIILILSLSISLLSFSVAVHAAEIKSSTQCKDQAIEQAAKLLEFHFGPDDRMKFNQRSKRFHLSSTHVIKSKDSMY